MSASDRSSRELADLGVSDRGNVDLSKFQRFEIEISLESHMTLTIGQSRCEELYSREMTWADLTIVNSRLALHTTVQEATTAFADELSYI